MVKIKGKTRKKKLKGRERRLVEAPEWVNLNWGKPRTLLKRYHRKFHVDWECAMSELLGLGCHFYTAS
jgi:hypothetical protein